MNLGRRKDPGSEIRKKNHSGSRIRILEEKFTGSRIRIRNTAYIYCVCMYHVWPGGGGGCTAQLASLHLLAALKKQLRICFKKALYCPVLQIRIQSDPDFFGRIRILIRTSRSGSGSGSWPL
jgi:hypothetical protein